MDKVEILNNFLIVNKFAAECIGAEQKGSVTVFDMKLKDSFRFNRFASFQQELMLALKSFSLPTTTLNPERGLLHVETLTELPPVPDLLSELSAPQTDDSKLSISLGTSLKGERVSMDIDKNPHMLIGGSTGSGKSSLLHTIISGLLLHTSSFVHIVDTKGIEFSPYAQLSKRVRVVDNFTDYRDLLKYLIYLMEHRYNLLRSHRHLNIANNEFFKPVALVIDEFADLSLQDKDNEGYVLLCQLVQKCRAAGIYCVLATQRPSADIITGVIKANFPARLACKVASKTDSRIILDRNGAENLTIVGEAIINNYKYNAERFRISYAQPNKIFEFLNEKMATNT